MNEIVLTYNVPDEQKLRYTITPLEGQLFSMESVGRQMVALAKLLQSPLSADDEKGRAFILSIETSSTGQVIFDVLVAPKDKRPTPPSPSQEKDG